jgi:pyruvate formate lyase activating enzyme
MQMDGVIYTDKEWLADGLCPRGAVSGGKLDREICGQCKERECLSVKYKSKGIRLSCEERTIDEVYEEIINSSPMFYDGGGVTFTGGEATMQFDALKELLIRLKTAGIHTAIETNGSNPKLPELFPYIDQMIMDCKHWDAVKHKQYTGIPIDVVLSNLKAAADEHGQVDIRIPFIGGVNDSEEDMKQFVALFRTFATESVTFEILKYHEFGKNKWAECGRTYQMDERAHVTVEQIKCFREMMINNGLRYKKS